MHDYRPRPKSNIGNVLTNEVITIVMPGEFKEVYEEGIEDFTHYYYLDFEKSNAILEGFGLK